MCVKFEGEKKKGWGGREEPKQEYEHIRQFTVPSFWPHKSQ